MVGHIMVMAMERPEKVLLQPMGMAMLGDHFRALDNNLKDRGDMARAWGNRPDRKRQAKKRRKRTPSKCPQGFHRCACLPVFSPQHAAGAILLYPPGEDSLVV